MTARIIDLAVYRAERPTKAVHVRVVFDSMWAVPCVRWIGRRIQTVIVASAERVKELG